MSRRYRRNADFFDPEGESVDPRLAEALDPATPPNVLKLLAEAASPPWELKQAVAANPNAPWGTLVMLAQFLPLDVDANPSIWMYEMEGRLTSWPMVRAVQHAMEKDWQYVVAIDQRSAKAATKGVATQLVRDRNLLRHAMDFSYLNGAPGRIAAAMVDHDDPVHGMIAAVIAVTLTVTAGQMSTHNIPYRHPRHLIGSYVGVIGNTPAWRLYKATVQT